MESLILEEYRSFGADGTFVVDTLCSLPRDAIRNDLVLAFLRSHLKSAFTTQEALSKIEGLLRDLT